MQLSDLNKKQKSKKKKHACLQTYTHTHTSTEHMYNIKLCDDKINQTHDFNQNLIQ